MRRTLGARILTLLIASLSGLTACDARTPATDSSASPQFAEADYATAVNAQGGLVSLSDFSGKPVWVDYAAEWCAACRGQSAVIRGLLKEFGDRVVFVTVLTSETQGYGHPATQETAARWARRESLDPSRVVAADLTTLKLPGHALFSPTAEKRFHHVGALSAAKIRAEIEREQSQRR